MPGGRRLALRWRLTAALDVRERRSRSSVATLVLLLPLDRRLRSDALATLDADRAGGARRASPSCPRARSTRLAGADAHGGLAAPPHAAPM